MATLVLSVAGLLLPQTPEVPQTTLNPAAWLVPHTTITSTFEAGSSDSRSLASLPSPPNSGSHRSSKCTYRTKYSESV